MAVTPAEDGTWYLLNAGACQVLHLAADFTELNAFGRCGQGPGEFENPVAMVLYGEEIWVFEMARISVFSRAGESLRTLVPGVQFSSAAVVAGRLAAILGAGRRSAAFLNDDGTVASTFGTSCSEDFFTAFKECRNQRFLPHPDGLALLLNPIFGTVTLLDDQGEPTWTRSLVEAEDTSRFSESDDGETVSMTITFNSGLGARDPEGRYWFTLPGPDEDSPMVLRRTDSEMAPQGADIILPEGISGFEVFFTPDGLVGLVSTGESVIHLCRLDGGS
jgi:hypothetical protein